MNRNDTIASLAVNAWINRNRVVWQGADLSGANLRGADLRGAKIALGNRTFTLNEGAA